MLIRQIKSEAKGQSWPLVAAMETDKYSVKWNKYMKIHGAIWYDKRKCSDKSTVFKRYVSFKKFTLNYNIWQMVDQTV